MTYYVVVQNCFVIIYWNDFDHFIFVQYYFGLQLFALLFLFCKLCFFHSSVKFDFVLIVWLCKSIVCSADFLFEKIIIFKQKFSTVNDWFRASENT